MVVMPLLLGMEVHQVGMGGMYLLLGMVGMRLLLGMELGLRDMIIGDRRLAVRPLREGLGRFTVTLAKAKEETVHHYIEKSSCINQQ